MVTVETSRGVRQCVAAWLPIQSQIGAEEELGDTKVERVQARNVVPSALRGWKAWEDSGCPRGEKSLGGTVDAEAWKGGGERELMRKLPRSHLA